MNTVPAKYVILAWALSEPPTLVHFIPKSANREPKRPKLTDTIVKSSTCQDITVQHQHGREVLALGDTHEVSNTSLPQVDPIGGGGDDRAVDGGHLPIVGGQHEGHQYTARDGDHEGDALSEAVKATLHAGACTPTRSWAPKSGILKL